MGYSKGTWAYEVQCQLLVSLLQTEASQGITKYIAFSAANGY